MGLFLKTKSLKNDNPYRRELFLLNEEKNEQCFYGELLLDFIYRDYTDILNKIHKTTITYIKKIERKNFFYNSSISINTVAVNSKCKSIKTYSHSNNLYHRKIKVSDKMLSYNEFVSFINEISSCIQDNIQYTDPYLFLLKCELLDLKLQFINELAISQLLGIVNSTIQKYVNLQDFYYEALNLCFNKSHLVLNKYNLEQRIALYSATSNGFNALRDFSKYALYSERYIVEYKGKEIFMDTNYTDSEDGLDLFTTPSTDVLSRKIHVTYDKKEKKLHYNFHKNYNITVQETPELEDYKNININKVIEFKNVLSLCNFEFNKLLEYKNSFIIKECQLCKKLFITTNNERVYCSNIFIEYGEPCSSPKVGKKIFEQLDLKEKEKVNSPKQRYKKIYKRLKARQSTKDKKASSTLFNCYYIEKLQDDTLNKILDFFGNLPTNTYNENDFKKFCEDNTIKLDINH